MLTDQPDTSRAPGMTYPLPRGLVGGVVIEYEVQVQVLGHRVVDQIQETQELLVTVPAVVLGDHRTAVDVEGGEQADGAMARIVVARVLPS